MPSATTSAEWAALLYDDVTELRPSSKEVPVDDDSAADPRPEREHDEIRATPTGSQLPLGQRSDVCIVLDAYGQAMALFRARDQIDALERKVRRAQDSPRTALEVGGDPVTDRYDTLVEKLLDSCVQRRQDVRLQLARAVHLMPCDDLSVAIDQAGEDLGSADVQSDNERSGHGAWLP